MIKKLEEVEPTTNDEFDKFFADAIIEKGEETIEEIPEEEPKPKEEIPEEEPKPKEEIPEEEPKLKEEIPEVKEEPKEDPRIAELMNKIALLEKQVAEPAKKEEAPKGPTPEEIAALKDEEVFVKKFEEDWGDHAAMFKIQQKKIIDSVTDVLSKTLGPIVEKINKTESVVAETESEKLMNAVLSVHKDAITLLPEIEKWSKSLPKYQQKAADDILDKGTPKDIIELYDSFKEATGRNKKEETPVVPPKESDEDKHRRLKSLESPRASRTGVAAAVDPTDFNGAFEEALKVV